MHILQLTPYFAPAYAFGGVVRSCEGMARALVRRGHSVTILTTDALNQTQRYRDSLDEIIDGVRVVRVRNTSPWLRGQANLSTPFGMRKIASELLPAVDIVHCHEFRTLENLIVTPLVAALHKPIVLSPHGTLTHETGRGALKAIWDRVFSPSVARRFTDVVGLSLAEVNEVRSLWSSFGAQANFASIPNGVDPQAYTNLPGRAAFRERYHLGDGPICLFMGRLHVRKGIGLLVEAFKTVDVPGARLVIVGPDEGMLATIRPMLDDRIIYTGYLGGADRLAAFAAADLLALPAVGEGLPMVVLEAMASGLPVIISPGCNLPEVVQYGAGIQADVTLEALRDALRQLLSDANKRAQMGAAAAALVSERFTWDSVAEQLEKVYLGAGQSA
jgi:glycosyltransferase involved in cell wall biosynthesis